MPVSVLNIFIGIVPVSYPGLEVNDSTWGYLSKEIEGLKGKLLLGR